MLFTDRDRVDVDAVIAHRREHLSDFEVPLHTTVATKTLPRNPSGTLLKNRPREQARRGAPPRRDVPCGRVEPLLPPPHTSQQGEEQP
ncbi:hypothetical protein [Streptomyces sp. NPDC004266]|uniref:hypothetical protein n=1 Tax=Streptomyces sp. NPDC004266 TaxID=3364693 RepID=UPI00367804E2